MKKTFWVIFVIAAAGAALRVSLFTVPAGETAVVTQFGKPVATITTPGLNWKLPGFIQRVNRINARTEVFNSNPIQLLLGDKNPIIVTAYIGWRVADPLLFYQSLMMPETARQKLADMVVSAFGSVLADYEIDSIINVDAHLVKLSQIEQIVQDHAAAQARDKYGIDIVCVGVRRLCYPDIVAEAVYNRMRAEREKEAKKYRAEGTEEAAKIEAATDKEVSQLMAQAYKESEIIKGHGDQEASRIYAEAYASDPAFFDFLRTTDMYRQSLKQGTTLIMSTDSQLFRYFDSSQSAEPEN